MPPDQIEELLARSEQEDAASADAEVDRVTLAPALALSRFRRRIRIAVVSPGLTPQQVQRMGFSSFATVEEALEKILPGLPRQKQRVDVVTHGGSTYPCVHTEERRS
jgi:hypothetical protein